MEALYLEFLRPQLKGQGNKTEEGGEKNKRQTRIKDTSKEFVPEEKN